MSDGKSAVKGSWCFVLGFSGQTRVLKIWYLMLSESRHGIEKFARVFVLGMVADLL